MQSIPIIQIRMEGQTYEPEKTGRLSFKKKRESPRIDKTTTEKLREKEILLQAKGQVYDSPVYKYLLSIFGKDDMRYERLRALTHFLSHFCCIPYPREYFRRKETTIYFLQKNFGEFNRFLERHQVDFRYGDKDWQRFMLKEAQPSYDVFSTFVNPEDEQPEWTLHEWSIDDDFGFEPPIDNFFNFN